MCGCTSLQIDDFLSALSLVDKTIEADSFSS